MEVGAIPTADRPPKALPALRATPDSAGLDDLCLFGG
jgi:hypothetical protein